MLFVERLGFKVAVALAIVKDDTLDDEADPLFVEEV